MEVLHSFHGHANGEYPEQPVTQGSDGNFYGTTEGGGRHSGGTVFKITLPAGALTVLYKFTGGADGEMPDTGLTLGIDGNFYGTTSVGHTGGAGAYGTVFQITPAGVLTTLYNFTGGADGAGPDADLTKGSDGNVYGTTEGGGDSESDGTIFKITPTGALTTLYTFSGDAGGLGFDAGLTQGSDGNFYGTTYFGGVGNGTVFKITPAGVFTTLYAFNGGAGPQPGLTQGSDGSFCGTTVGGGNYSNGNPAGNGTVFKITPAGLLTTLHLHRRRRWQQSGRRPDPRQGRQFLWHNLRGRPPKKCGHDL